ncbi:MAG: hypothetical protein AABY40_01405 [Nanoarchaeota archaeon]
MGTATRRLLEILEEQPNQEVCLTNLEKKLAAEKLLGFGVEAKSIVYRLNECDVLSYDRDKDVVSYKDREKALNFLNKEISYFKLLTSSPQ